MSTISTDPGTRAYVKPSRMHKLRNRVAGVAAGAAAMVAVPTAAFAAEGDAAGTAEISAGFDSIKSFLTTVAIPGIIGIVLVGIVVVVGLKYLRKGASKA